MAVVPVYQRIPNLVPQHPLEIDHKHWVLRDSVYAVMRPEKTNDGELKPRPFVVGRADYGSVGVASGSYTKYPDEKYLNWSDAGCEIPYRPYGDSLHDEYGLYPAIKTGFKSPKIPTTITVTQYHRYDASTAGPYPLFFFGGTSNSVTTYARFNTNGTILAQLGGRNATTNKPYPNFYGKDIVVTITFIRSFIDINYYVWVNGELLDHVTSPYPNDTNSDNHQYVYFLQSLNKSNSVPHSYVYMGALHTRKFSDAEIREFHSDPFAPIRYRRFLIQVPASGGPTVQPVGPASETDTGFPISALKRAAANQAMETDGSQSISKLKHLAVGQPAETDISQGVGGRKNLPVGQPAESDASRSIAVLKRLVVGQPAETDTAQPATVSGRKLVAVGLAVETGAAPAVTSTKLAAVSLVLETDTSLATVPMRARVVAQAGENDAATGISVRRDVHAGLASETDSAPALTVAGQKLVPVGPATETDVAQALSSAKAMQIGLATETDAGLVVTPMRTIPLGGATEIDAAAAAGLAKAVQVGLTNETDSAFAIVIPGLTIGTKIVFTATSREINFTVTSREIKFTVLQ